MVTTAVLSYILAGMILSIEFVQFMQDPKDYVTSIYNWLEASGNILIFLVQFPRLKSLTWFMILLIQLKAVLTLKIFKA